MRKKWTSKEEDILKSLFPDNKTEVIALKLGRSYRSVALHAQWMGIKKSEAFIAQLKAEAAVQLIKVGVKNRFSKGAVPPNKGKKQTEWLSDCRSYQWASLQPGIV